VERKKKSQVKLYQRVYFTAHSKMAKIYEQQFPKSSTVFFKS